MVRRNEWKLVSAHCNADVWELYNIEKDRTEQNNLATQYPEKVEELKKAYFDWADKTNVLYFPEVWNTYNKNRRKDLKDYR